MNGINDVLLICYVPISKSHSNSCCLVQSTLGWIKNLFPIKSHRYSIEFRSKDLSEDVLSLLRNNNKNVSMEKKLC